MLYKCIECGTKDTLIKHHVFGKRNDPDTTVYLCPNCHDAFHRGLILFENRASTRFDTWLESQQKQGYVGISRMMEALDGFGYVPCFDGWENTNIAHEIAGQYYQSSPIGLKNYLLEVSRLDLWPG